MLRSIPAPALFALALALSTIQTPAANGASLNADDVRVQWLEANSAPIRSVDPGDEDFSDLEPLRAAIGDARVVLLGEQTHGHGTTFLAKTRLIKFLHQRMGFDVLAFESGLYDCAKAWDYMLAGEAPDQAFRRGVFGVWNGSEQIQPLIRYLGARARTARPLELAGFDSQFTATASRDFLLSDLDKFLQSHGIAVAKVKGWADLETLLNAQPGSAAPAQASSERLRSAAAALDELHARVAALPRDSARYGTAFWTQMLESMAAQMAGQGTVLKALEESTTAQGNAGPQAAGNDARYLRSWRDMQMGRNFLWLARERYPDRKIIVWAATYHNMRNAETIVNPDQPVEYKNFTTMGQVIWEGMRDETYNIGFLASEGSAGWWRNVPQALEPATPDSVDGLWARTKHQLAFLDLKRPAPGGEWLRTPLLSGLPGDTPVRADVTKIIDGLIYTRVMKPSTPAGAPPPAPSPR